MGESVVEPGQQLPGAGGLFSLALDLDAVAARRNINAQPVFQRYHILVIFAEQLSQHLRPVEQYLPTPAFYGFRLLGFSPPSGHAPLPARAQLARCWLERQENSAS